MLKFKDLETKHGAGAAHQILAEIEKAADIKPTPCLAHVDPEIRLANAIKIQDAAAFDGRKKNSCQGSKR